MTPLEPGEACFAAWAPDDSVWSPWAKPVAFTSAGYAAATDDDKDPGTPAALPAGVDLGSNQALVVDVSGPAAVRLGVSLARRGFRPVPLFNGTAGPMAVVNVRTLAAALGKAATQLTSLRLPPDAPPAFLLDSRRKEPHTVPRTGQYDNRWVVLPQDFPSGALLASRGIRFATVLRRGTTSISPDLAHVLRRWNDHGIPTRVLDLDTGVATAYGNVPKPSFYQVAWYAAIALFGLRRSNVGGFGSTVPDPSSSGGFG